MHQQSPYSQGQYGYQQPNYHQQLIEASGGQPGYGNNQQHPNSSPSLMGNNSNSHLGGMMNQHHSMSAHQQQIHMN